MGSIRSWSNWTFPAPVWPAVWPAGTVKVTTSPTVESPDVSKGPAGVLPVWDTEGRGLNTGVEEEEEEEVGLDDCCGLKGLSLLKKFTIPSRKVICPWACEAEMSERTTTDNSHSLILMREISQDCPHLSCPPELYETLYERRTGERTQDSADCLVSELIWFD